MKLVRVNGPPGTGKTTYLSERVKDVADKYGGGAVVVASLTRAAAAEVAGRKTPLPRQNIGTLHSHAYQVLKRPAIAEMGAGLKSWNEWVKVPSMRIDLKHAVDPEHASAEPSIADTEGAECLNAANIMRQQMIDSKFWAPKTQRFWAKWCEWKATHGMVDFTDMIERVLEEEIPLSQKPLVLMIDEAQDMSKLEFALAMMWGSQCQWVMVVGDADQNLYEWRGSDPEAFTSLDAAEVRTLDQSYRVPQAVHAAAVAWIEQVAGREPVEYKPRPAAGVLRRESHTWRDPVSMLTSIEQDMERYESNGDWPSVMVLATCGYMLNPLIGELRTHGTPFWNPYRVKAGNWNPLRGGGRVLAFIKPQHPNKGGEGELWTWKDLHRWVEPLQAKGLLVRGIKGHIEAKCHVDRFKDTRADEVVPFTDVMNMFTTDEARGAVIDGDIDWWEAHLKHDDRKRQQYALTVARRRGFAALRATPRLCVGTIHSVKGGQADVVYLMPDLSTVGYFQAWQRGDRDPIIRQFYVGMTRAREELVLCAPSGATTVRWK